MYVRSCICQRIQQNFFHWHRPIHPFNDTNSTKRMKKKKSLFRHIEIDLLSIHRECINVHDILLLPATKLGQGYIFTGVCDSVQTSGGAGGSASVHAGIPPCQRPRPPSLARRPPCALHAAPEIRSTSGRYASYWNAILFQTIFCAKNCATI